MTEYYVFQPFKLRNRGGTVAVTDDADVHLRDKVLAVLFTAPGERVNDPRFGVGLSPAVFEGLDELTASAVEFRVTEGLRRELGDEAVIDDVDIVADQVNGELLVSISYRRLSDRAPRTLEIAL